jgi:hypothetical protein
VYQAAQPCTVTSTATVVVTVTDVTARRDLFHHWPPTARYKHTRAWYSFGASRGGALLRAGADRSGCWRLQGALAYLFVVSANDKQWAKHQDRLRTLAGTFRA